MVMVLGVDVHKDTHTVVAVDEVGRANGERTVRATDTGHRQLLDWARRQFPQDRMWAVEDCRHVSTRLERALLAAGETVVRVPPKLMAGARSSARTRGKSGRGLALYPRRDPAAPGAPSRGLHELDRERRAGVRRPGRSDDRGRNARLHVRPARAPPHRRGGARATGRTRTCRRRRAFAHAQPAPRRGDRPSCAASRLAPRARPARPASTRSPASRSPVGPAPTTTTSACSVARASIVAPSFPPVCQTR